MADESSYLVGTILSYFCDVGYGTRDSVRTECLNGSLSWSLDGNPPTCTRCKLLIFLFCFIPFLSIW